MKISEREKQCLQALFDINGGDYYNEEGGWAMYSQVVKATGLTFSQARRSVRALVRKGLAEFDRLFDDDGFLNGSGHHITQAGIDLISKK